MGGVKLHPPFFLRGIMVNIRTVEYEYKMISSFYSNFKKPHSDGQDRLLNDKDGNEHFVVFRCPRNKENIFSKFTDLPIQQMEHNK